MSQCKDLTRDMLSKPIDIAASRGVLDLSAAMALANAKAGEFLESPMLLAWYDSHTGRFSPNVE